MPHGVDLRDIYRARAIIRHSVEVTPLVESPTLSAAAGVPVLLKLETAQSIGSFKIRGATHYLSQLSETDRTRGVVTFSTGNHGHGVAFVARQMGARCVVCMSEGVPLNKIDAIRELGAEVRSIGQTQDDAEAEARRISREEQLSLVPAFDHPWIVAGQGTMGLEILEDQPDVDAVVVPLSGGGSLAGIAVALKAASSSIRIIGVSIESCPAMYASLRAGHPIVVEERESLADCLLGGIGLGNSCTFPIVRDLVDDIVLVGEQEVVDGIRHLYLNDGVVAEGAAAVGVGALLHGKLQRLGRRAVLVISGRNIDADVFARVIDDRRTVTSGNDRGLDT